MFLLAGRLSGNLIASVTYLQEKRRSESRGDAREEKREKRRREGSGRSLIASVKNMRKRK